MTVSETPSRTGAAGKGLRQVMTGFSDLRAKCPRLCAWLELLRLPNLFTVPGDVLAGWALAGCRGAFPVAAVLVSLAFYSAGLIWNDVFDFDTDARERPRRPLPSGRIPRAQAFWTANFLALFGLFLAGSGWGVSLVLLGLILFYNLAAKKIPGVGVLTMGLCRGTNLLLGVACSWPAGEMPVPTAAVLAGLFFTLYILIVSLVAKNETQPQAALSSALRFAPVLLTLALVPLFWWMQTAPLWYPLAAAAALLPALRSRGNVPAVVSGLIRGLIPLQMLWCAGALAPEFQWVLLFLLGCWGLAVYSGREFSGS